jgi:hypothetical protein
LKIKLLLSLIDLVLVYSLDGYTYEFAQIMVFYDEAIN